jgi:GAF domain-containing protein
VFLAGADRVGAFDEVSRELADLLAATAEAALDRRSRESQLREQERRLQRQNDQLARLNRTNETIREIDQALVRAETREEVDYAVCEHLTGDDRFSFAWIGTVDRATDVVEPRAWAGAEQGYLDSVTFAVGPADAEPAGRTAATGAVTTVSNVAADLRAEPWRTDAISRDFLSVVSIPLVYNDLSYGVLTVYAGERDAFDETSRTVLQELGETVAAAISAIERKNALLAPTVTRVEFATDDQSFVLSRLAREADCTLSYRGGVQQTAEGSHVFVTVEDGSVERVERAAADLVAVEDVHQISDGGSGSILRLALSQPFPALELADHGAVFRRASASPETTTLVVDVPESVAVRRIADLVRERFADVELRSKGTVDQASEYDVTSRLLDRLTDRQLDVIQTAYYSGFFESPRESTGEDVAETLGISSTAFYGHVRSVQRKLFATLFDELGVPVSTDDGPRG